MDIYQEQILDLYKNPLNKGVLEHAQIKQHEYNPSCGDDLTFYLLFEGDTLKDIRFDGHGCAISQASASLLTEEAKGKTIQQIHQMSKENILELLGIELGPTRLKCALLSLQALSRGTIAYEEQRVV